MSTPTLSEIRALLHDTVCVGVRGGYCERGDGDHAKRTMTSRAREILTAEDPAEAVHDVICDAGLSGGCPDRHRHIEHVRVRMDEALRGPVCRHCDTRCHVPDPRVEKATLATCEEGQRHDRLMLGYNHADVEAGRLRGGDTPGG